MSSTNFDELIGPTLAAMGFELVQARLTGGGRPTLQVVAEPLDRAQAMSVEDCAAISHAISAVLDVTDPIPGTYSLEVSSPGLDRPLVKVEHFQRFLGQRARIETDLPIDGRRRFTGVLEACEADNVTIAAADRQYVVPLAAIRRAKLAPDEVPVGRGRGPAAA